MEQAYEKQANLKLADELLQKIDTMEKNLGPEYAALVDGLELFDPEKDKLGAEIMFELAALNMLCTSVASNLDQSQKFEGTGCHAHN